MAMNSKTEISPCVSKQMPSSCNIYIYTSAETSFLCMYKRELWPYSGVAKGGQRGLEHPFFSCALAVIKPTAYPRKLVVYVSVTHLRLRVDSQHLGSRVQ